MRSNSFHSIFVTRYTGIKWSIAVFFLSSLCLLALFIPVKCKINLKVHIGKLCFVVFAVAWISMDHNLNNDLKCIKQINTKIHRTYSAVPFLSLFFISGTVCSLCILLSCLTVRFHSALWWEVPTLNPSTQLQFDRFIKSKLIL